MKRNLLTLMVSAMVVAPAFAQVNVNTFPKPENRFASSPMLKSPVVGAPEGIDDKSKGIMMYAGQIKDQSKMRSFVKFRSSDASNFTRIKHYYEDKVGEDTRGMTVGVYDGKDYYGIFGFSYTYGDYPWHFSKVDMVTGDTTAIYRYTEQEQSAWYNGDYIYAMAYDKAHDQLCALGTGYKTVTGTDGEEYEQGYSVLYAVDRKTGLKEKIQDFDCIYMNFAYDLDGNCYMLKAKAKGSDAVGTLLVKFNSDLQEVSSNEIKSEWGEPYIQYYFGALNFDNTTGKLYWIPVGQYGASSLYEIDLDTYKFRNVSYFMTGNSFTGLAIPYLSADSRKAPAQVSNLTAQPDLDGKMAEKISWKNPTKAWDKTDLSELKEVLVYRKKPGVATSELTTTEQLLSSDYSELVATVAADGKMGEEMSWTDTNPNEGMNTYYVLASRVSGEKGVPDSIRCYAGLDVPGAVSDITLKKNGEGIIVSWTAPNKGANNGYVDEKDLTYNLVRMPDNKLVVSNLKETTYDDQTLGEQQLYYYVIQASNSKGKGAKAESGKIMAGSALSIPVDLKFETQDDADRWNLLNDGRIYWFWDYYTQSITGYAESTGTYDGSIISTPLKLEGGKTYRFTTDFYVHYAEGLFNLKLSVGNDANSTKGATVIRDMSDMSYPDYYHREQYEDMFTAPADGTYYYGLYVKSEDQYNVFKLYGLKVEEVCSNDLKAVSIDNIKEAVVGKDNNLTVKLRNTGSKEQGQYTVKVYCDDEGSAELVGETSNVPTVKSGDFADVPMTIKPTKDGKFDFYAVVELEGDEDDSNNQSESVMLNVLPEGSVAWTNVVTNKDDETQDTHGVVLNYDKNEKTQNLYLASEINADENATIKRVAFVYDDNGLSDRTDPIDFKVYLAQTDKKQWTSTSDWLTDDQLTLVYEGQNTYEPGKDNLLAFDLQTPFAYDKTKNLVVLVEKNGSTPMFCTLWKVFNASSTTKRMLEYGGTSDFLRAQVPVLYLAIDYASGIENVTLGGDGLGYNNGVLTFGKNVNSASVYTVDGTLVGKVNSEKAQITLKSGLYIVRTVLANGKVESVKLNVK